MKNRNTFRRITILVIALLLLALAGCKSGGESSEAVSDAGKAEKPERPTVTVCMDLDIGSQGQSASKLTDIVHEYAPELKESYKLVVEAVPGVGKERETALDHIRVEMMAGEGPDLFLCRSPRAADPDLLPPREREEGLFQYPKALMNRRMFLPLDDYIKNAQYMEWDKLYPQIMEAGRNQEGQLILPISWTMNFTRFDAESYTLPENLPMTFEEMLQSEDPGIILATWSHNFDDSLGMVADYENDKPAFTREELQAHLEGLRANRKRRTKELSESLGQYSSVSFGRINAGLFSQYDPDSVLIPQYNRDGGATAYITTFGAVNINSKAPEGAFRILELLMSRDVQKDSELCSWDRGAPVHMELMAKKEKIFAPFEIGGRHAERWGLTEYNYNQLQDLIKQINAVDFFTPVHHELTELYDLYMQAETDEEREKLIEKTYRTVEMMLAES